MEWWLIYAAIGAGAGLIAGLLGVGGGVVVVPSLALAFAAQGVPDDHVMPLAIGTSLASIVVTSLASLYGHHAQQAVDWHIVLRMVPGLTLGALTGASVASRLPSQILTVLFAVFLWAVATQLLLKVQPGRLRALPGRAGLFAAGGVIGCVSGAVGIGGGSLSVPFLTWCRVSVHNAIGTAAAAGFPIALAGTTAYVINGLMLSAEPGGSIGFVHFQALVGVTLPSVLMAPLGARLAHRLPAGRLRAVFAVFLYLVGGRLALRVFSV